MWFKLKVIIKMEGFEKCDIICECSENILPTKFYQPPTIVASPRIELGSKV